jgi:hypothetical protein
MEFLYTHPHDELVIPVVLYRNLSSYFCFLEIKLHFGSQNDTIASRTRSIDPNRLCVPKPKFMKDSSSGNAANQIFKVYYLRKVRELSLPKHLH